MDSKQEQDFFADRQKRYEEMIVKLMEQGFSRRNAVRYIKSQSNKVMKKFQKQARLQASKEKIYIPPEEVLEQ